MNKTPFITTQNILNIDNNTSHKTTLELWPEITDKRVIYKDTEHKAFFIDVIAVTIDSECKKHAELHFSLNTSDNKSSERFTDTPLTTIKGGKGHAEIEDCIVYKEANKSHTNIVLRFQFPKKSTDTETDIDPFKSFTFRELYLITEDTSGKQTYHEIDPSVIIIRG